MTDAHDPQGQQPVEHRATRADRFVDDFLEDGTIDGAIIVRPEDQVDPAARER